MANTYTCTEPASVIFAARFPYRPQLKHGILTSTFKWMKAAFYLCKNMKLLNIADVFYSPNRPTVTDDIHVQQSLQLF